METKINLLEDFDKDLEFGTFMKAALKELKSNVCDINAPLCVWLYRDETELKQNADFSVSDNLELRFIAADLSANYHLCITYNKDIYNIRPKYYSFLFENFTVLPDSAKKSIVNRFLYEDWRYYMTAVDLVYRNCTVTNSETYASDILPQVRNYYTKAVQWQQSNTTVVAFPYYRIAVLEDGTVTFDDKAVFKLTEVSEYIEDIYYFTVDSRSVLLDQTPTNITVRVQKDETGVPQEIYYPGMYADPATVEKQTINISNEVLPHANYTNARVTRYSIISREARKS